MIIVVMGLPGSGKSYFARRLAALLGAEHINSDTVRKAIGASGRYSFEDKLVVYAEMARITEQLLDEHKVVVADATFYHPTMREIFHAIARKRKTDICFIQIEAKESLIEERLKKPRKDSEADFQVYKNIREQLHQMTYPHLNLESTNDNVESMVTRACAYIESRHDNE